jgi:uncharacterized protein (TIGR02300 family)
LNRAKTQRLRRLSVAKPEWGTKQTCPKCGTRFYDLGKDDPVTCIDCGNEYVPEPILKSKQPLPFEDAKAAPVAAVVEDGDDLLETDDIDLDEAEDDSVGDVSLDDDDADLSEVVDKGNDELG